MVSKGDLMTDIRSISSGLKLGKDGIWYSEDTEKTSYPESGNESCLKIEESSFWFRHRNNCIITLIKSFPPIDNGAIFDIGGGNGYVSLGLINAGFDVITVEPGIKGALAAKKRGIKNIICATANTAKFKQSSLPAVGLFDVVEHIKNDLDFLLSINAIMKKNSRLYLTVPSYSFLWSAEDDYAGHYKRYNLKNISQVIRSAGFQVEYSTYFFRFLPFPIFFYRTLPYKIGLAKKKKSTNAISSEHATEGGVMRSLFNRLLISEIHSINRKETMAFGGSCLIAARKT